MEYFEPTPETYGPGEKKDSFQTITVQCNVPGHSRVLMEMCNEINVFTFANATSIAQPLDQGVILTFKCYYLRIMFNKDIASIDSDFADGSGKSKLKTLWKGFTILDAIKNISDTWEEVKKININSSLEEVYANLINYFEGFKTSVEEVTADVVEIVRELKLEMEPEDAAELLRSHNKAIIDKELLFMDEQRKWFLEVELLLVKML